jgi:hypothetical protein
MSYSTYTDDELRRELAAQPYNVVALIEAAERFCNAARREELRQSDYDEGYQDGREAGYREVGGDD